MGAEYDDFPVEPDEATDLGLHVRNCLKRHTALVKMINRDRVVTWLYRFVTLPVLCTIAAKLWGF